MPFGVLFTKKFKYVAFSLPFLLMCLPGPIKSCPTSYVYDAGDVPGLGTLEQHSSVDNIDLCAQHCDDNANCCSFEYSPSGKKCNLNSECKPTKGVVGNWAFCVKGNHTL